MPRLAFCALPGQFWMFLCHEGIMMNEGFRPALSSSQQRTKGLPVDWNTKFINEWIFEYTRFACISSSAPAATTQKCSGCTISCSWKQRE